MKIEIFADDMYITEFLSPVDGAGDPHRNVEAVEATKRHLEDWLGSDGYGRSRVALVTDTRSFTFEVVAIVRIFVPIEVLRDIMFTQCRFYDEMGQKHYANVAWVGPGHYEATRIDRVEMGRIVPSWHLVAARHDKRFYIGQRPDAVTAVHQEFTGVTHRYTVVNHII